MILYSPDWGLLRTDVSSPLFATMKGYINLYQMPLFFTISGYLFYHAIVKDWDPKAFISKKVLRLLVPYFSIAFLWLIPIRLIIGYYSIDQLPVVVLSVLTATSNSHLWFVFTLFGIFMLYYCLFYHAAKIGKVQFLIPIFTLTNALINRCLPPPTYGANLSINYFCLDNIFYYSLWFILGTSICLIERQQGYQKWITSILAIIASRLALGNVGVIIILLLALFILYSPNYKTSIILYLDKMSFGLYLIHSPLCWIMFAFLPNINPYAMVLINLFLIGALSILIVYVTSKSKIRYILGL